MEKAFHVYAENILKELQKIVEELQKLRKAVDQLSNEIARRE